MLLCSGLQQTARTDTRIDTSPDITPVTIWLTTNRDWLFRRRGRPYSHLHTLLVLYAQGRSAPLHFYPRTRKARTPTGYRL